MDCIRTYHTIIIIRNGIMCLLSRVNNGSPWAKQMLKMCFHKSTPKTYHHVWEKLLVQHWKQLINYNNSMLL